MCTAPDSDATDGERAVQRVPIGGEVSHYPPEPRINLLFRPIRAPNSVRPRLHGEEAPLPFTTAAEGDDIRTML